MIQENRIENVNLIRVVAVNFAFITTEMFSGVGSLFSRNLQNTLSKQFVTIEKGAQLLC